MKTVLLGFAVGAGLVVASCGTTSSSTGPSTLSSLPKATGAVTDGTAVRNSSNLFSATTGVVLKNATTATFSGKSRAFCETAQTVKNLLREASKNDKIACYIGAMEGAGAFSNSYDGNFKYYQLTGAGEGGTMQIKFKAAKDSGGVINNFQMFTCQSNVMQEYLSTTISGGTASMSAVSSHSESHEGEEFSGAFRVSINGNYGTTGWTGAKTVVGQGSFNATGGSNNFSDSRYVEMTQASDQITLQGSSSHSFNSQTGSSLVYAIIQGLNMGEVATFALGDGTGKATFEHSMGGTHNGLTSWDGDTKLNLGDITSGAYYTEVNAATLPSATTPDASFTSEETWDCAAESSFTDIDFEALQSNLSFVADFSACNEAYGEDMGNDFIDCPHSGD